MIERLTPEEGCQIDDKLAQIFRDIPYEDRPHFGSETAYRIAERIPRFDDYMPGRLVHLHRSHVNMTLAPLVTPIEWGDKVHLLDMQKTIPLSSELAFHERILTLEGKPDIFRGTIEIHDTKVGGWLRLGEQDQIVMSNKSFVRVRVASAQSPHLSVAHSQYNAGELQLDGESFIHADADCAQGGCYYDAGPASAGFLITADGEPKRKVLMRILNAACVLREA